MSRFNFRNLWQQLACLLLSTVSALSLNAVTCAGPVITSTRIQSGFAGVVPLASTSNFLTVSTFSFSGQSLTNRVDWLSITLTLSDGDTGLGDADAGAIELTLDGVKTGLFADGFRNRWVEQRTFSGAISSVLGTSLTAAFSDGIAILGIVDHTNNLVDRYFNGNFISAIHGNKLPNSNAVTPVNAHLAFTQVPEPATATFVVVGLALITGRRFARRRPEHRFRAQCNA
jgi:hypothetical protein